MSLISDRLNTLRSLRPLRSSLRVQLVVVLFVFSAMIIGGGMLWLMWDSQREGNSMFDNEMQLSVRGTIGMIPKSILEMSPSDFFEPTGALPPGMEGVYLQIWRRDGALVYQTSMSARGAPQRNAEDGFTWQIIGDERWRVYSEWDRSKTIQVQVSESMRSRNAIIRESLKLALVEMSIYLPIIGLVVIVLATWSLRHLTVLNEELLARSATDLTPISPQPLPNEFQPLVNGFNDLLQRLDTARMREQRFLADATHELRTPLAALRLQAQVAMRVSKDEDRRAALGALVQGIDRTARLTEQLLAVSRIDGASTGDLPIEIIQLDAAVEAVFAELKPLAELRRISLTAHVQGQALTTVDWMLNVAIRNLVDNAIRHCPTGAVVSVTCKQAGHGLEVIVSDTGPGIEAVHRTQLGQRFFRVPGTTTNGSGLGFSIVVAICERLDATLRIEPHLLDGTGLRVTILFPYTTMTFNTEAQIT